MDLLLTLLGRWHVPGCFASIKASTTDLKDKHVLTL